jgi:hypothetical protein
MVRFAVGANGLVVLVSPNGKEFELAIQLDFTCMNNQVEYEGNMCQCIW